MLRDLVVLSHLRWTFVWQRPQHVVSRLATGYDRTWFVEEPEPVEGLREPRLLTEVDGPVIRVVLQVPPDAARGYDAAAIDRYTRELERLLGTTTDRTVWLYTPMALEIARALQPASLAYDVMDDLAAFRFAPEGLVLRQRQALRTADVVFAGGRSLHRSVIEHRPRGAHCFPSGVEPEHFAPAAERRASLGRPLCPVAGYVGVIDERMDLDLVGGLAEALPDWEIRMVGPIVKIDERALPQAPNLTYPGSRRYEELPDTLGEFDVALMPFALNEATQSISPTKTLEYLAAGLPVVSTRVPDVVADYSRVVELRDDADGFAAACRDVLHECRHARAERARPVLRAQHWDTIAEQMQAILEKSRRSVSTRETA